MGPKIALSNLRPCLEEKRPCSVLTRVGRFCTFFEFYARHVVCGTLRYNMGENHVFLILVQKTVRATYHFKRPNFQKNPKGKKLKVKNLFFETFIL